MFKLFCAPPAGNHALWIPHRNRVIIRLLCWLPTQKDARGQLKKIQNQCTYLLRNRISSLFPEGARRRKMQYFCCTMMKDSFSTIFIGELITRSSAIAEGPRNALSQLKFCQLLRKSQIPLRYLVADRFEAGRRPAVSRNLAYHLARASRSATSFEPVCDQIA